MAGPRATESHLRSHRRYHSPRWETPAGVWAQWPAGTLLPQSFLDMTVLRNCSVLSYDKLSLPPHRILDSQKELSSPFFNEKTKALEGGDLSRVTQPHRGGPRAGDHHFRPGAFSAPPASARLTVRSPGSGLTYAGCRGRTASWCLPGI